MLSDTLVLVLILLTEISDVFYIYILCGGSNQMQSPCSNQLLVYIFRINDHQLLLESSESSDVGVELQDGVTARDKYRMFLSEYFLMSF